MDEDLFVITKIFHMQSLPVMYVKHFYTVQIRSENLKGLFKSVEYRPNKVRFYCPKLVIIGIN